MNASCPCRAQAGGYRITFLVTGGLSGALTIAFFVLRIWSGLATLPTCQHCDGMCGSLQTR